ILNAGVLGDIDLLQNTGLEAIKQVFEINVWVNKVLIEELFKSGFGVRQVIAISSGASVNGSLGWGAYSLSKSTLNMLIQLYSFEYSETHFSAIAPGLIQT